MLRSALFNLAYYLWTAASSVVCLPLALVSRRWLLAAGRIWGRGMAALCAGILGLRYRVTGRENLPAGPVILACKHQSTWETLVLPTEFGFPAVVLKQELTWIPVFGWLVQRGGSISVDRRAGAKALRGMLRQARARLAEGMSLLIFPEGTRTAPGEEKPYHPGIAALYLNLHIPVVPVALNSGVFWGRRRFVKRGGTITVEFLPAIEPGLDRQAFLDTLRRRLEPASRELAEEARAQLAQRD
jgi:1-acyl-sn-glycerol-3-phosphate acyltransferase